MKQSEINEMNPVKNEFSGAKLILGETVDSPFVNREGVYQDGTVPLCRDKKGILWGISGHSHMGNIGIFRGENLLSMKKRFIETNFQVGLAGRAFDGICYPEGVRSRGSVWPFGLFIVPETGRFYCFFHNESGWNGKGSAYDSVGPCVSPKADSDFRHIGLMHSDDEGRSWSFDRWVLSSEEPCFTQSFNPDGLNLIGQKPGHISLGSGDFSLFLSEKKDYLYLFYNIIRLNMDTWLWEACDTYVARSRIRHDGVMGDFVKYYEGSFGEAGNFGKETPVAHNTWHPRVVYWKDKNCYVMSSAPVNFGNREKLVADYMELRTSPDMLHWSEPITVEKDGAFFGNHYNAILSRLGEGNPYTATGNRFTLMTCHNGTDVKMTDLDVCFC